MKKKISYILLALSTLLIGFCIYGYRAEIPIAVLRTKYATPPSKFIEIDNFQVHYRDEGKQKDAIPLVLIHGTSASLFTWDAWTKELSNDFRIIRLDLPNYALTGSDGHTAHSGTQYAEFLKHFLDKLGVKRCYLAGNSMGGEVVWQFARLYPERVDKMVLIDAMGFPVKSIHEPIGFHLAKMPFLRNLIRRFTPKFLFDESIKNVYADPNKVTEALIQQYLDLTLREGNRDALLRRFEFEEVNFNNHRESLPNIKTPTMVLWGAKDELIPLEAAMKFHEALPNDTLIVFPNAGHVPMEELGVETAEVVLKWLKN
jgi:pimeloyl-ACP methyl ester carboxylesterase